MKPYLLGVTPQLHEKEARKVRGSLNRASGLIAAIIIIPTVLWALHALELVPSFFGRELPPEVVSAIGSVQGSVDGATGFMVEPGSFLTTERALVGDGAEAKIGDLVQIAFIATESTLGDPVGGKVSFVSERISGIRLAVVKLDEDRPDYLALSEEPLVDATRYTVAGFKLDSSDGESFSQAAFPLTVFEENFGSAEWGDAEAPPFEGAPVLVKSEETGHSVLAILSQGTLVLKIPIETLKEAGLDL